MTKTNYLLLMSVLVLGLFLAACSKKDDNSNENLDTSQALTNYWSTQTDLTQGLESRDSTMTMIVQRINNLNARSGRDAISDIDAMVNDYVVESENASRQFDALLRLENNIIPYGDNGKNIFGDVAGGIYNKAKGMVVSGGRMVRSGWRVLSGKQSLRQVLNDPESGIPLVSDFAEKIQKHNADRDAAIRQQILSNNNQDGMIPLDQLQGNTPQEKINYYLNLSDDDPLKMNMRRDVMMWDEEERTRTANTAKELGETGVKTVGDSYGGGVGEWTNEVLLQNMNHGQDPNDKGTVNVSVNEDADGTPAITGGKTLILAKKNMPEDDSRITVIVNAPQTLTQPLPSGDYSLIVIADGFIREVQETITVTRNQVQDLMAKLLKLSENAIVIESLTAEPPTVMLGDEASVRLSCVSTIGQNLDFNWQITGGSFTDKSVRGPNLTFKPTQEGNYSVTVTITDGMNNTKVKSIELQTVNAKLTITGYTLSSESFYDNKINPGELVTLSLNIKNNGTQDLVGTERIEGTGGITVNPASTNATIPTGETGIWDVNIQLPVNYSETTGKLNFFFDTVTQTQQPVTICSSVVFPVDFYVEINPVTEDPVTSRVLTISGRVANPQLSTATMFLDGDMMQPIILNLSYGNFSNEIALSGSINEVAHTVTVIANSGSNEAENSIHFNSLVPACLFRMTLTWDTGGTDVDFWCTDPNGEKCYYAHRTTASGLALDFDDTNGYGPENITLTPTPSSFVPGDYLVQVHYYSDHDSYNAIYTNCQVVIRLNEGTAQETTRYYYGSLNDTGDIWTVTTLTFTGTKWITKAPVQAHSYTSSAQLPPKQ
ncbi:MAG TPA: DUF2135 domain-containing protein [Candidatus Cloacimonadota bacterium]|nr:DUF2135 domain-containing protein [Candidatus Cloacimonadota bacterium]HQL15434.1 DUF2135 domain-containing protein [Candidatus Cloacimonadota bacterium]